MTDDQILEVVQAHKEGKKIQGRVLPDSHWYQRGIDGSWNDLTSGIDWNFYDCEYRVAPEPPQFISGYCFAYNISQTPILGMIKVQQVELEKGENPLPRKPREWKVSKNMLDDLQHSSFHDIIRVREVLE